MQHVIYNNIYLQLKYYVFLIGFSFLWVLFSSTLNAQDPIIAKSYLDNGEFDKAQVLYEKLQEQYPSNEDYYQNLIICFKNSNNSEAIEKLIRRQIKRFPKESIYQADLGIFLKKSGDIKNGITRMEEALKNLTPRPDIIEKLAARFLRAGEFDYAVKTYEIGEKVLGKGIFGLQMAEIYLEKQDYKAATTQLIKIVEEDPRQINSVKTALSTWLDDNPEAPFNKAMQTQLIQTMQNNSMVELADLLIWLLLHQKNYELAINQAKALDKRLKENGERLYELGNTLFEFRQFDLSIKCHEYVVSKGVQTPLYIIAKYALAKVILEKTRSTFTATLEDYQVLEKLLEELLKEAPSSDEMVEADLTLCEIKAFHLDKATESKQKLLSIIENPGIKNNLRAKAKLLLANILLMQGDIWEPSLLYGQVEKDFKNDVLGHEAKFRNAKLAFFRGDFEYAQLQMEVLKAATSRLTSNDAIFLSLIIIENLGIDSLEAPLKMFARAELHAWQRNYPSALHTLDSIIIFYPERELADEVLFRKGEINIQFQRIPQAIETFEELLKTYPSSRIADAACFRLAELEEYHYKNPEKAMALYEKILTDYKGSLYTAEARKRYRLLRGDRLN